VTKQCARRRLHQPCATAWHLRSRRLKVCVIRAVRVLRGGRPFLNDPLRSPHLRFFALIPVWVKACEGNRSQPTDGCRAHTRKVGKNSSGRFSMRKSGSPWW
jgi:hypothetical protein